MKPSLLYRGGLWRAALAAAKALPPAALDRAAASGASAYGSLVRSRREIVIRNLLPVFQFNRPEAEAAARRLFRNFGLKLASLWRYETGHSIVSFATGSHVSPLLEQCRSGRGVLLLTLHIGNWEFGAALLQRRGINLQVITQAEPQAGFTELRAQARSRRGIETLVIGENPFAFVEVIRRLEQGAVVALLMDRPPAASSVTVKMFGRKFAASIAAAELARASGCALLPVLLPRAPGGYHARVLPEISYDRAALGTREARANLTQEIMRQFEPSIREYADQWYHFVPLWQTEDFA